MGRRSSFASWWKHHCRRSYAARSARFESASQPHLKRAVRWVLLVQSLALLAILALCLAAPSASAQGPGLQPHREALQHKATLRRNAQMLWGLDAPVATFAAQIHQESRWRLDARSPVGALGLAQFMPTTAAWMGQIDPELRGPAPLNPTWALRAVVSYDRWLWQRIKADSPCERMAYTLAAYNGGLGWVYKRQGLSANPGQCLALSCEINPGISPASQRENAHYPVVILQRLEPLYETWGPGSCP